MSTVKQVYPLDPDHPRRLHVEFDTGLRHADGWAEFETEEAAQDWLRELNGMSWSANMIRIHLLKQTIPGAVFLYRHSRQEAIRDSNGDATNSIRFNIPLECISSFRLGVNARFPSMAMIHLHSYADPDGVVHQSPVLQVGPIMEIPQWAQLGTYIDAARARARQRHEAPASVLIDFGALTLPKLDGDTPARLAGTSKENEIRAALGLGGESELWSEFMLPTTTPWFLT